MRSTSPSLVLGGRGRFVALSGYTQRTRRDGVITDVVAEWAQRHGQPYRLILGGPAGGTFEHGTGEALKLDAVELWRTVSSRTPRARLLATGVAF
jgi:hypothetical protein